MPFFSEKPKEETQADLEAYWSTMQGLFPTAHTQYLCNYEITPCCPAVIISLLMKRMQYSALAI